MPHVKGGATKDIDLTFDELGLPARLSANLDALGLKEPTPIQLRAIPEALNGRDIMGLAQTGTGKTAAFGLPLVSQLMRQQGKPDPKQVRGLVLAPTRELAKQIHDNLRDYADGTSVRINLVVGGASLNAQAQRLARGTGLLVATPGRLIDLLDRGAVKLDQTQFLVLDEADQMLDLGFIHALRRIAALLPKERQTMLFSATMPKQMAELSTAYLTNPVRIETAPPGKPADKIDQSVFFIEQAGKGRLLSQHLAAHRDEAAVVFSRTKHGAERLMKALVAEGFAATSVHGNKSQGQRERAIRAFRSGEAMILVATDVAARGLDIPDVRHVYNFDLPNVAENYVHRIGRTARAGRDGSAVAYCAPAEMGEFKAIQKILGREIEVAGGTAWAGGGAAAKPKGGRGGRRPQGNSGKPGGAQPSRGRAPRRRRAA